MSYYENLSEKAVVLGQQIADNGSIVHITGFMLARELADEAINQQNLEEFIGYYQCETALFKQLNDAGVTQLADVLRQVTNVTFNDAVPTIKSILEKMSQVINPDIPVAYATTEVVPVVYHDVWDSPLVMDAVGRGRANTFPPKVSFAGMIRSIEDEAYSNVAELALTGVPGVDELLSSLMSQFKDDSLTQLFRNVFNGGWLPNENPIECLYEGGVDKDQWIIVSMWSRKLRDIAPRDSAFDLDRYRANLTALDQVADRVIAGIDELRQLQSKNEQLVLDIRRGGKCVLVNNDLYVNYLKDGGSPEAVLGTTQLATGGRQFTLTDLKGRQEELEKAWTRHVAASTAAHAQNMHSTARRQLHIILDQTAAQRVVDEKLAKESLPSALNSIASFIGKLPSDFLTDLHRWVFDIIGGVFYPNSNVGLMLTNLREVGDVKDSGFSAEEIRVIAVTNFVGDWIADILTQVSHGAGKGIGNYFNEGPSRSGSWGLESLVDPQTGRQMAVEGVNIPSSLKEWAQFLGLVVLGAGVGYAIGTLLNKIIYGKSKAQKAKEAAQALIDAGIKEVPRTDIIAKMEKLDKFKDGLPRLFVEAFNDSSDWRKLMAVATGDIGNVPAFVGELKDIFSCTIRDERDEKHFIENAHSLAKRMMAKSYEMGHRASSLAPNLPDMRVDPSDNDKVLATEEQVKEWIHSAIGKYEEMVAVGTMGRTGNIMVPAVAQNFVELAEVQMKEFDGIESLLARTSKELDADKVKELTGYSAGVKDAAIGLKSAYVQWSALAAFQVTLAMMGTVAGSVFAAVAHDQKLPD